MTPREIDRVEAEWMSKLEALVDKAHADVRAEMKAAGHTESEIRQAMKAQMPDLDAWLEARRKDIRSLIVSGSYGLAPVLADGTLGAISATHRGK